MRDAVSASQVEASAGHWNLILQSGDLAARMPESNFDIGLILAAMLPGSYGPKSILADFLIGLGFGRGPGCCLQS